MKKTISFVVAVCMSLLFFGIAIAGDVYVRGYTRRDGTYVQPHYRSAPDGNFSNNWSTKGNVNPYTGEPGTKLYPNNSSSGSLGFGSTTLQPTTPYYQNNPSPTWNSNPNSGSLSRPYSGR